MQSVDIQLINAAQSIVYNVFAQDAPGGGTPHHHSQHTNLQAIGFGGFWRFAQSFSKSGASSNMDNVDLFAKFVHILLKSAVPFNTSQPATQLTTPRVNTLLSMSLSSVSSIGGVSLTGFDNDEDLLLG